MVNILSYLSLIPAAGFCYQYVASGRDENNYLPPGELIDVGGYKLHLQCQGTARPGMPTVIIETGLWDSCQSWQLVQSEIATSARICTYDRAGYGWSEQALCPRTFEQIIQELKILLEKKKIHPPFIFVGHSLGGPIIRYYQSKYPNEVAGMVFVDAIPKEISMPISTTFRIASQAFLFLAYFGLLRLLFTCCPPISANPHWTSTMQKTYTACHQTKIKSFTACLEECDRYEANFKSLRMNARSLKDIPVTIISRDPAMPLLPWMSKETAKNGREILEMLNQQHRKDSPHARFVIAEGSSHLVQIDRPDVIIDEIRRMIDCVNKKMISCT